MPSQFIVKKGDNITPYFLEKTYLMDGDIDGMRPGFYQDIRLFRGFDTCREEDWTATRSTDAEITVPLLDIIKDLGTYVHVWDAGMVTGINRHYATIIGEEALKTVMVMDLRCLIPQLTG
jgi:hypothetical protein